VICTTPTGAVEALTGLPPLDLVIQGEVRSAAHCPWSLGCWSYLHSSRGCSGILMQLQGLDSMFNMEVDVTRPTLNREPKYRVTILTREKWTRGPWTPVVKGLVGFMDGSRMTEGTGAGVCGQSSGRRLSISMGKYVTVFQAEVFAILACVYEIQTNARPDKCVSICSDSQAALRAIQATETMPPLVQKCQKVLNDICTWHIVGLYWFPEHAGVQGNEIADKLATGSSVLKFVGLEPSFTVSRQNLKIKVKHWVNNQHLAMWHGPSSNQRQALQLIMGPSPTIKTRLLSFYKTQSGLFLASLLDIIP